MRMIDSSGHLFFHLFGFKVCFLDEVVGFRVARERSRPRKNPCTLTVQQERLQMGRGRGVRTYGAGDRPRPYTRRGVGVGDVFFVCLGVLPLMERARGARVCSRASATPTPTGV